MTQNETLTIKLIVDNGNASQKLSKTTTEVKKLDTQIKSQNKSGMNFKQISAGMVAGYAAVAMAIKMVAGALKESINLFLEQDKQNQAVANTFGNYASTINDAANEIQNLTTVGNEQYQKLAVQASNFGIANNQVNESVQGAIGLSTLFADAGLTQETALKAMAAAQEGNYSQLNRYIPALQSANTEQEKAAILQDLTTKGMIRAKQEAETFEGRIKQMKNSYGDLQEVIGGQVLGGLFDPKEGGNIIDVINKISSALERTNIIQTQVQNYIKPWQELFKAFSDVGEALGIVEEGGSGLDMLFKVMEVGLMVSTTPLKLFAGQIQAIVKLLQGDFKGAINDMAEPLLDLGKAVGIVDEDFELMASGTQASLKDVSNAVSRFGGVAEQTFDNVAASEQRALNAAVTWANGFSDVSEQGIEVLTDLRIAYNEEKDAFIQAQVDKLAAMSITDISFKDQFAAIKEFQETTGKAFNEQVEETTKKYQKLTVATDENTKSKEKNKEAYLEAADDEIEVDYKIIDSKINKTAKEQEELDKRIANNTSFLENMIALNDAEIIDDEDTLKRKEELYNQYFNKYAGLAEGYATDLTGILSSSIDETGLNIQQFGQKMSLYMLDMLQKIVTVSIAEIIAKSFALNPIAGGIVAGISVGLVKGAFSLAKSQISQTTKFGNGGILDGPSHAQGGILTPYGELEGGEAVINKRSTKAYGGILSAVNMAGGGVPIGGQQVDLIDYNKLASAMQAQKVYVVSSEVSNQQWKDAKIRDRARF